MTDGRIATAGNFDEEGDVLVDRLRGIQRDLAAVAADAEGFRAQLAARYTADPSRASVELDEAGLISVVSIDPTLRDAPERLRIELDIALLNARNERGPIPLSTTAAEEVETTLLAGERLQPVEIANDFSTVAASALLGDVVAVRCDPSWVVQTPVALIEDEVLRVARQAARASDTYGRFSEDKS